MQLKVRVRGRITSDTGEVLALQYDQYLFTANHFLTRGDTKKLREIMFGKFLAVVPELGNQVPNPLRGLKLPSLSTLTCSYKILEIKLTI